MKTVTIPAPRPRDYMGLSARNLPEGSLSPYPVLVRVALHEHEKDAPINVVFPGHGSVLLAGGRRWTFTPEPEYAVSQGLKTTVSGEW